MVKVEERASATPPAGHRPAPAAAAEPSNDLSARGWLTALGAAGLLAGGVAAWRLRRRGPDAAAQALSEAARARASGDAEGELGALARALRAALARGIPATAALSAEEIRERTAGWPAGREAAELLEALERARFQPGATPPAAEQVERAVRALYAAPALRRASAGAALCAIALACGALLPSGCASAGAARRDAPMTPARIEATLREEASDLEVVQDQFRFTYRGVRMICVADIHADRMRILAVVGEEPALSAESARTLLSANFGETLDARYAIREGLLYAVYLHPLSTLAPRDLESALVQVSRLVKNYGTSYSAGH